MHRILQSGGHLKAWEKALLLFFACQILATLTFLILLTIGGGPSKGF